MLHLRHERRVLLWRKAHFRGRIFRSHDLISFFEASDARTRARSNPPLPKRLTRQPTFEASSDCAPSAAANTPTESTSLRPRRRACGVSSGPGFCVRAATEAHARPPAYANFRGCALRHRTPRDLRVGPTWSVWAFIEFESCLGTLRFPPRRSAAPQELLEFVSLVSRQLDPIPVARSSVSDDKSP